MQAERMGGLDAMQAGGQRCRQAGARRPRAATGPAQGVQRCCPNPALPPSHRRAARCKATHLQACQQQEAARGGPVQAGALLVGHGVQQHHATGRALLVLHVVDGHCRQEGDSVSKSDLVTHNCRIPERLGNVTEWQRGTCWQGRAQTSLYALNARRAEACRCAL